MRRFFGRGEPTKFKKNDLVQLNDAAPYSHLTAGAVGVVSEVYPGSDPSYEVEFVDARGATLDRLAVKEKYLSRVEDL